MDTKRVFVGELYEDYEKDNQIKSRRIGYRKFYYLPKKDAYFCFEDDNLYCFNRRLSSRYIIRDSLISYESFAKPRKLFNPSYEIENKCNAQIEHLTNERYKKLYSYDYTNEQIDEIHQNGELTLDEKVMEILSAELCYTGDAIGSASCKCEKYSYSCKECTYATLKETGEKSFKPFEYKPTHSLKLKYEKEIEK